MGAETFCAKLLPFHLSGLRPLDRPTTAPPTDPTTDLFKGERSSRIL